MKKILIVASHHDDEILGCGGTVNSLVKKGNEAFTLILGEGPFSRENANDDNEKEEKIKEIRKIALRANDIIGIKKVYFETFPDNRFDSANLLDIIKVIEKVKQAINPTIIFTHYKEDLNIDHQITYKAVLTAFRPMPNESVKEMYSFPILSSTEWNFPLNFSPDIFFDITESLDHKIRALQEYKSEPREFPHPRSAEGIKVSAKYWGMTVGLKFAEPFKNIRIIH